MEEGLLLEKEEIIINEAKYIVLHLDIIGFCKGVRYSAGVHVPEALVHIFLEANFFFFFSL